MPVVLPGGNQDNISFVNCDHFIVCGYLSCALAVMTNIWSPECLWNLLREPALNSTMEKLKLLLSPVSKYGLPIDLGAGHQAAGHFRRASWAMSFIVTFFTETLL